MSIQGIILVDILSLGLFILVFNLVRTHKLHIGYGVIWLLSILSLMVLISFPPFLNSLPQVVGAVYPASALSLLAFLFIFSMLIFISVQLTKLSTRQIELIQHLAINQLLVQEKQGERSDSNNVTQQ